jgi:hypothetical protein
MLTTILVIGALAGGGQEDTSKELHAWIEKLRSERIEDRDQATQEIRKLGKAAIGELEQLAGDKDIEVASRARTLIRAIRLKEVFGIDIKQLDDLPASTLVEWMEKKTGRKFLYTLDLGLRNMRIRVPEGLAEATDFYAFGVDLLRLVNIGVCPSQGVPGAMELFPSPLGSKKSLKVCSSVDELPKANEMCALALHPRHISPRSVQVVLINAVSFPQNVICVEESGTLLVTDHASVLRKCAQIVAAVDVARSFRISVALLEGRAGKEEVPEAFRNLRLGDATGLQHFALLGTASLKLERVVVNQPGAAAAGARSALRFAGPPTYVVEFDGSVRASGGPTLDRFTVRTDQDRPARLFEAQLTFKDENWMFAGAVPTADGASLVILVRAVPD